MEKNKLEKIISLPLAIIIAGAMLSGAWMYNTKLKVSESLQKVSVASESIQKSELEEKVLPSNGVELPVIWGDLGKKLVNSGAIDGEKFKALYEQRGQFTKEYEKLLFGNSNENLKINEHNAGYLLNLFWALGLANNNPILSDEKEIANPAYNKSGPIGSGFASTGGWSMAVGDPMNHYGSHKFFDLMPEQQALVDKVSRGIYRPCCGNSTHFPDCNHGMAMLGLLELLASQGVGEKDMWKTALTVNAYWFPDTYITLATYMKNKGIEWQDVNPEEILGFDYSSASGFAKISAQVTQPAQRGGGNGCGVDSGQAPTSGPAPKQQSGCGI